jgi:hypothetical protein
MDSATTTRPPVTDRLAQKRDAERRKAEDDYARFVAAIADGHEPAEAAVARALAVLGRQPEDLAAAAGRIRHRRALRAELAGVPEVRRQAAALRAECDATLKALNEAQERHQATVDRCWARAQELDRQAVATQDRVARELERTAPPELVERRERLQQDLAALQDRARSLTETRGIAQVNADQAAETARERTADESVNRRRAADAEAYARRLAEVDAELDDNRDRQAAVRAEAAAAERRIREE